MADPVVPPTREGLQSHRDEYVAAYEAGLVGRNACGSGKSPSVTTQRTDGRSFSATPIDRA